MYDFLRGRVARIDGASCALDVCGVGYSLVCTPRTAAGLSVDSEVELLTHMQASKEGAPVLYGFKDTVERSLFRLLIGVSGVGPASALALLTTLAPGELASAVARGDEQALTAAKGIGKKAAGRIVVDLKERMASPETDLPTDILPAGPRRDAVSALMALGYTPAGATQAVEQLLSETPDAPLEEIVRRALAGASA